jgi:hypothetical protein
MKIFLMSAELFIANRKTDINREPNIQVWQFSKAPKITTLKLRKNAKGLLLPYFFKTRNRLKA